MSDKHIEPLMNETSSFHECSSMRERDTYFIKATIFVQQYSKNY